MVADQRQITNFGAMSWAPYEHPSGKYFVFASNKLGFDNFELYMVDAAGTKEPVRVTYSAGFDGLPVPSPDGKTAGVDLVARRRIGRPAVPRAVESREGARGHRAGAAQDVRDQAMKHRPLLLAFALSAAAASHPSADATKLRTYVQTLASERFGGRMTGTEGEALARQFIVSELTRIGARPLPGHSDFDSPFEFTAGTRDGGSTVSAGAAVFPATDARALSFSDNGDVRGPVVFAGYGIVVPDSQDFGYDSYATLDVKDKVVLVLRYFPEDADQKTRNILARYSDLRYKAMAARQHGAKAMLVVTGPHSPNAGELAPMTFDTAIAGSGILALSVTDKVATSLFATGAAGKTLSETQKSLDSGNPHVAGFALPGVEVGVHAAVVGKRGRAATSAATCQPRRPRRRVRSRG